VRQVKNKNEKEVVKVECLKCHGPTGLGDGPQLNFDDWNVKKNDALTKDGRTEAEVAAMWTLPVQRIKPRNLRLGVFRGGRRPVDVYRRIAIGINGTPMPAHAATGPQDAKNLQPAEIWALVDYLLYELPYGEEGELRRQAERPAAHKERL
jgi:mono/diheme cytochrome c family protein